MREFADIVEFYLALVQNLKNGSITLDAPLDVTLLRVSWGDLAYVDNRRDAQKSGYDFWKGTDTGVIGKNQLYSESQEFPDFVFKAREEKGQLLCGSLLETKDSRGGGMSSFNSTIPSATKSLDDVDAINNSEIVSKIASLKDGKLAKHPHYRTCQRRCFYLIRTHSGSPKAKTSLVDGSFFETVPKDHLISQVFLNILEQHRAQNKLHVPEIRLAEVRKVLAQITDQAIIAGSQSIEKASIKPRLRVMAEVNPEGNPHSSHYPQIEEKTVNFILPQKLYTPELGAYLSHQIPELKQSTLQHKRNGKYTVFQFKMG
ncbi:MAG: hypothetical protein HYX90_05550 [Chloroflexi bacterium]|nr:hypothetical protein [Chloroflexota bacterium]